MHLCLAVSAIATSSVVSFATMRPILHHILRDVGRKDDER